MPPSNTVNDYSTFKKIFTRFPPQFGYDATGNEVANSILGFGGTFPFNFVRTIPLTWLMPGFVGTRGSIIWHFNWESNVPNSTVKVQRIPNLPSATLGYPSANANFGSNSVNARNLLLATEAGSAGQSLTNQFTQAGISVLCPNYTKFRFQSTNFRNGTNPSSVDGMDREKLQFEVNVNPKGNPPLPWSKLWQYAAIGTDFNLHFFLNVPMVWNYLTVPTTV
jgi:hypothetical protein